MTAARRQSLNPLEVYDTPAWMVRALGAALFAWPVPTFESARVFEPCAGANSITRVLRREFGCSVLAADIEPREVGIVQRDTIDGGPWPVRARRDCEWVITNPPFSRAADLYKRWLSSDVPNLAMLLRLNWLEPTRDRDEIRAPNDLIVLPRISGHMFVGKGSDALTVAWCVWRRRETTQRMVRMSAVTCRALMLKEGARGVGKN